MKSTNKEMVREYLEEISGNPKTQDLIDKYVSEVDQELKNHIEVFETGFPLYEMKIEDIMAEEDKVAVRFEFIGEHHGSFMEFPPSGKKVGLKGIIIYQIKDLKIINHWMAANMSELIQQLSPQPTEV